MAEAFRPADAGEVQRVIAWAAAERQTLALRGQNSKAGIGGITTAIHTLDLSGLASIGLYEPEELVLTARPGTPMAEVNALLAQRGQELAFEPPDYGALFGAAPGQGTLGGIISGNLAGPRRFKAGAARDHFLGCHAVSGRGEAFKAGSRVVKNVTGYDLCKVFAGSWGTLVALTEVTVKVLPRAEKTRTVLLLGLDDEAAVRAMSAAGGSPHEVSGLAHLPANIAARSSVDHVSGAGQSVTAIRVEGSPASVAYRCAALRKELNAEEELHSARSDALWREIRDVALLAEPRDRIVWRISVPPVSGSAVIATLRQTMTFDHMLDWAGGLIWLATADANAVAVRAAVAMHGGHATLFRAPDAVRRALPVWQPEAPALAALSRRMREQFDPHGVLNPGRFG